MKKYGVGVLCFLCLCILCFLCLCIGTGQMSFTEVIRGFFSPQSSTGIVLWKLRIPRIFLAILAGGLLATSGMILQIALKNELASPDVIGLNKASALGIIVLNMFVKYPSKIELIFAAVLGACVCAGLLYSIAKRFYFSPQTLILIGLALSFFFDAVIKLGTFNAQHLLMKQMFWLTGSLCGRYWEMIPLLFFTAICFCVFFYFTKESFFLLQLDDELLPTLGKNRVSLRWLYILTASLVSAITVSTVGAIGFIGLIAPHISRRILKKYTPIRFVLTFFIGSVLLLIADTLGRSLFMPIEVPAGIIVSLIGGPYFLLILVQQRKRRSL